MDQNNNSPLPQNQPTPVSSPTLEYAGFWRRFLAYNVDVWILLIISLSLSVTLGFTKNEFVSFFRAILGLLISAGYFIFFWINQNGQTLGKKLLAIRVVREDGRAMDISTAILRYIGYLISSFVLSLGFLWIGWDKRKQGWHDKIAKTFVVKTNEKPHTGIAIVIFVIPLILLVIFFSSLVALFYQAGKNPEMRKSLFSGLGKIIPTLTAEQAEDRSSRISYQVKQFRLKKGLSPLDTDSSLCAFAVKRVDELTSRGQFDGGKGFYEASGNPEMRDAYFINFKTWAEDYYPITAVTQPEEIMNSWTDSNSIIDDPQYSHVCVKASHSFMVVVLGEHK